MGTKKRKRRAANGHHRQRSERAIPTATEQFVAAVYAERSRDWPRLLQAIDALSAGPAVDIAAEIAVVIEQQLPNLWGRGWQPADLVRLVDRELGTVEAALVRWAIASEAASYAELGARVAVDWMAQLQGVDATRTWDPSAPYLLQVSGDWREVLFAAVRLTSRFASLPELPCLADPPSAWREGFMAGRGSLPGGVLDKVRALLAKAESTNFDAEAEAFTAKAQELMTRHRIDRALLEAGEHLRGRPEGPVGRRFGIDDPYADAKAVLLGNVADANGCRAVWSKTLGFSTVFGFADELDAVDELFTSLLVQATAALRRAGSKQDQYGRSRTRRFRRSFLVAFAIRIGQRLRDTVDATVEAATVEKGSTLVPILAARASASTAAAESAFPETRGFAPAATDGEGWHAGTRFADQADISLAPKLTRQRA